MAKVSTLEFDFTMRSPRLDFPMHEIYDKTLKLPPLELPFGIIATCKLMRHSKQSSGHESRKHIKLRSQNEIY